jgi:MoaA/NifB/PqqE/SkfB family radical SAM enzyme
MISATGKKLRLFRQYAARNPMWCAWQVTYRCNFRCGFCQYWRDPMGDMPEQTLEQFEVGSRKLAKLGTMFISLAGGEPLLRDDIVELARLVCRQHVCFMTTNGWGMTPDLARDLFAAKLWGVSLSLDYADAATHDRRRGMPGAFDQAVRAMDYLRAARRWPWQRVNVMTVLMHDNLDQIEPLLKLSADHGAYLMVQPYCYRKTGSHKFEHNNGQVGPYLLDLKRRYRNFLSHPIFLGKFDQALNGGVPGCQAGRAFFNIDSTGDIAICVEQRHRPVANLFRDHEQTIVRRLRDGARGNRCTDCWYNCRGEVEMLMRPWSLALSLPELLFDRGRLAKS